MDRERTPATHQPTKAELNEPVRIDATLDELGEALMQGGAPRREPEPETPKN